MAFRRHKNYCGIFEELIMKIFYKTRKDLRNSKIKGRRIDFGANAANRWAIELPDFKKAAECAKRIADGAC